MVERFQLFEHVWYCPGAILSLRPTQTKTGSDAKLAGQSGARTLPGTVKVYRAGDRSPAHNSRHYLQGRGREGGLYVTFPQNPGSICAETLMLAPIVIRHHA
jgi:hypothetical protein